MYRKSLKSWGKHLDFMILDMLCLHLAFVLAFVIRQGPSNPYTDPIYRSLALVISMVEMLVMVFSGTLKNVLKRGYYKEFAMTVKHVCLVEVIISFYLFSIQEGSTYSRFILYLMGFLYVILSYVVRLIWKAFLKKRMLEQGKRSLLIVTEENMTDTVVKNIKAHNYEMFHICGIAIINKDYCGQMIEGIPVVANEENVVDFVCREWVDEVLINLPREAAYPNELIDHFLEMGIVVHVKVAEGTDLPEEKQFVERMGGYTVVTTSINYATATELMLKRIMDILGGLAGCLVTGVLFIFLAPLIYIESPGPIFFSQIRVGKNGRKFKMYKFRSMYMDAEERKKDLMKENNIKDGMMFKLKWDPRIIGSKKLPDGTVKKGIGNYIRDLSLDEFPQFFNVLKGDMSLVGTRPPTVDEWEQYELHHRARLATKPGLTGMWQVSGRSNITDFEEVVKLDMKYIREWSIGLDCRILAKTVGVVFKKEGAM